MSVVVELPPELESELAGEAAGLGLSLSEYLLRVVRNGRIPRPPRTGTELLAYWKSHGVVGTRPEIEDSPDHARRIRQQVDRRERP